MNPAPIAITGATGRLGGRVARALAADGAPLRLVVRDPSRAPELPASTVARAAYDDPAALRTAFDGVETVFFVSGAEAADRLAHHRAVVDAAAAAGVRRVVYTSFLGAAPDSTFTLARDHHATEQSLLAAGLETVFLRDSLYADFLPAMAGDDGVIRGPAGDGRVAPVTVDDVADCAVAVLRNPAAHAGRTYELTGPEALTLDEIAAVITDVTGRAVRYEPETLDEAYASRAHYGAEPWQLDAWVSTYTAIADGSLSLVSDDVERVSGHPATSVRAMLELGAAAY